MKQLHPAYTQSHPAYAALAYRKALLDECVAHLLSLTSAMGTSPKRKVYSDDLFRGMSQVPEEEINGLVCELQQQSEGLRLEMARFEFVRRDDDKGKPPTKAKTATKRKTRSKAT